MVKRESVKIDAINFNLQTKLRKQIRSPSLAQGDVKIMILRDLLDLAGKEKRKKERGKAAQKLALGVGIGGAVGLVTGILCSKSG